MGLDAVVINNNPETVIDRLRRLHAALLRAARHRERARRHRPRAGADRRAAGGGADLRRADGDRPRQGPGLRRRADRRASPPRRSRSPRTASASPACSTSSGSRARAARLAGDRRTELRAAIDALGGLPVIVRPSWVIGGRGIAVLRTADDVAAYLATEVGWPLRVDELVDGRRARRRRHQRRDGVVRCRASSSRSTRPASTPATPWRCCRRSAVSRAVQERAARGRRAGSRWRSACAASSTSR